MALSLNRAQIIGHLGGDPEIKRTQDGRSFANFSVATTEHWKDKQTGDARERTEWHRVVVWNENLVGIAQQYLKKGTKVFVEGRIETRKFNDKNGVEKSSTEIVLQAFQGNIITLEKRDAAAASPGGQTSYSGPVSAGAPSSKPPFDDEIPF